MNLANNVQCICMKQGMNLYLIKLSFCRTVRKVSTKKVEWFEKELLIVATHTWVPIPEARRKVLRVDLCVLQQNKIFRSLPLSSNFSFAWAFDFKFSHSHNMRMYLAYVILIIFKQINLICRKNYFVTLSSFTAEWIY